MIAPHLISESTPSLQLEDTGEHALLMMHEYSVNQLAVVDGISYVGLITREEITSMQDLDKPLKGYAQPFRQPFVKDTAHIFDIMKAAVEFSVRVVPVIDEEHKYLGLVSAESCLRAFAVLNSVKEPGGIIELEISATSYSLSEIARIVEENDAEIVCLYTNVRQEESKAEITLKLNTTEVAAIVAAFERYEYDVKGIYNDSEYTEDLKDRYDALMRYLNV
jgi:acetoin utilization protein AcuB